MRKVVFSIVGSIALGLTGCGDSNDDAEPGMKIAFAVSDLGSGLHAAQANWAKKYAEDQYGASVTVFDGGGSDVQQQQHMDTITAGDFNMASFHVWNLEASAPKIQAMIDKGMYVNSFFEQHNVDIPSVQADEALVCRRMGEIAAAKWKEAHPDTPIVFVQLGWPNNPAVQVGRQTPFREGVLSVDPTATELTPYDLETKPENESWTQAAQRVVTNDLLANHPEVNIIFGQGDVVTAGIMPALAAADRGTMNNGVPTTEIVASVDCPEDELFKIYNPNSSLAMSMALPPRELAKTRIDTLFDIKKGTLEQVSEANRTQLLVPATLIGYWESMTKPEAEAWYNEQFDASISIP